jgi:integrase
MQILRHAKIATTMDIYTHVPTRATRAVLGELSRQLDEPGVSQEGNAEPAA